MAPKRKNYYFTTTTENAICRYNNCNTSDIRNRIYEDHIQYAFEKLVENIIHTFKFYYFDVPSEDVKHEVVSFLVMNMHKYAKEKGKAFSYFSIVAKNYLILHNNNNYKKMKIHDNLNKLDFGRNFGKEESLRETDDLNKYFVNQMLEYWENNLTNIFRRKKDINVANAVLELFRRRENIENFNKKALYILIREMTDSNTQHITRVVNVMKRYHERLYNEYLSEGDIDTSNTGSIF
tara:strand:+ start:10690 stop:11397 length:708 start_codon:yes stop_codon:yes gene_type:complete